MGKAATSSAYLFIDGSPEKAGAVRSVERYFDEERYSEVTKISAAVSEEQANTLHRRFNDNPYAKISVGGASANVILVEINFDMNRGGDGICTFVCIPQPKLAAPHSL